MIVSRDERNAQLMIFSTFPMAMVRPEIRYAKINRCLGKLVVSLRPDNF